MLDERFDTSGWREGEDCGCLVAEGDFGGSVTAVHHWIPDDTCGHIPDAACGCEPVPRENPGGLLLFEHFDQDLPDLRPVLDAL